MVDQYRAIQRPLYFIDFDIDFGLNFSSSGLFYLIESYTFLTGFFVFNQRCRRFVFKLHVKLFKSMEFSL